MPLLRARGAASIWSRSKPTVGARFGRYLRNLTAEGFICNSQQCERCAIQAEGASKKRKTLKQGNVTIEEGRKLEREPTECAKAKNVQNQTWIQARTQTTETRSPGGVAFTGSKGIG
eukprot:5668773-Pleurochrysis_carterae.AAC.2